MFICGQDGCTIPYAYGTTLRRHQKKAHASTTVNSELRPLWTRMPNPSTTYDLPAPTKAQCEALTDSQCCKIKKLVNPDATYFGDWSTDAIRLYMTGMDFSVLGQLLKPAISARSCVETFDSWKFKTSHNERLSAIKWLWNCIVSESTPINSPATLSLPACAELPSGEGDPRGKHGGFDINASSKPPVKRRRKNGRFNSVKKSGREVASRCRNNALPNPNKASNSATLFPSGQTERFSSKGARRRDRRVVEIHSWPPMETTSKEVASPRTNKAMLKSQDLHVAISKSSPQTSCEESTPPSQALPSHNQSPIPDGNLKQPLRMLADPQYLPGFSLAISKSLTGYNFPFRNQYMVFPWEVQEKRIYGGSKILPFGSRIDQPIDLTLPEIHEWMWPSN